MLYKAPCYKMHCKSITLLHTNPSEFLAELTNNQHSPIYIVICDPLLKLLVIPLHHVIEYMYNRFCQSIYMVHAGRD